MPLNKGAKKGANKKPKSKAPRSTVHKKPVARPPANRKLSRRPTARRSPAKKAAVKRRKPGHSLGRVRVPVDARLDLVFQKDYQAREIFDFLKVQTIRDLEQFGPDEIIERITGPMTQTVLRIRKMLALANRHLAKDERFAKDFLAEVKRTQ